MNKNKSTRTVRALRNKIYRTLETLAIDIIFVLVIVLAVLIIKQPDIKAYANVHNNHQEFATNIKLPKVIESSSEIIQPFQTNTSSPQSIYNITEIEYQLLANLIYYEANIEPIECQMAIAQVVFNRLNNDKFPNSIIDIIFQENQFQPSAVIWNAEPTETNYEALDRVIAGEKIIPDSVTYFWAEYVDTEVPGSWFNEMHINNFCVQISRTIFYYGN